VEPGDLTHRTETIEAERQRASWFGIQHIKLEEPRMRTLISKAAMALVAAGVIGGAATLTSAPAQAAHWHAHHHHHWHGHHYGWHHRGHCRVVVRHVWRYGHRVTVRRRTCW
jgi:hypothetical protein